MGLHSRILGFAICLIGTQAWSIEKVVVHVQQEKRKLIYISLAGEGAWGPMGDSQGYTPSRSMLSWIGALRGGLDFGSLRLGGVAYYLYSGQQTSPSNVQNQNLTGYGYLLGPELGYLGQTYYAEIAYLLTGSYKLVQLSPQDQGTTFDRPAGVNINFGTRWNSHWSIYLFFRDIMYSGWRVSGVDTDIGGNKISQIQFGLGLRYDLL